tara:strand:+ start:9745 stop:9942 length:198 start_codon:yes stop_codon:yes gene_type:complete
MPEVILKKEIIRTYGEFEKIFPVGTKYFVNWETYHQMVQDGTCDEIGSSPKKTKTKTKSKTKKTE